MPYVCLKCQTPPQSLANNFSSCRSLRLLEVLLNVQRRACFRAQIMEIECSEPSSADLRIVSGYERVLTCTFPRCCTFCVVRIGLLMCCVINEQLSRRSGKAPQVHEMSTAAIQASLQRRYVNIRHVGFQLNAPSLEVGGLCLQALWQGPGSRVAACFRNIVL